MADAGGDDVAQPPPPALRADAAPLPFEHPDWRWEEAPPRRIENGADEALIVEADLSALGLFRLETRQIPGGFAMVARHAAPLDPARQAAFIDAVTSEAQRYGVRARIHFDFDPALRPRPE